MQLLTQEPHGTTPQFDQHGQAQRCAVRSSAIRPTRRNGRREPGGSNLTAPAELIDRSQVQVGEALACGAKALEDPVRQWHCRQDGLRSANLGIATGR